MFEPTAVILFNLGGPVGLEAVRPFLINLFSDAAIIRLPWLPRWFLARLIAWRRAPIAREIYAKIGNRSPILEQTQAQALALDQVLADLGPVKCIIAMRYWQPRAAAALAQSRDFGAKHLVLLP